MSAFMIALMQTLGKEKGYVNHPKDKGGPTNHGVSLHFLRSVKPDATIDDIKKLTAQDAANLFRAHFWPAVYDILPQELSIVLFDLAVNMGPDDAHRCLQRALRALGRRVKDDGILGAKTLEAMRGLQVKEILPPLRSEAAGHYRCLVAEDPTQEVFLDGWLDHRAYRDAG